MNEQKPINPRAQITGNAGLYYAAWQLSRRGWNVMPTVRNARGSDLIAVNADETVTVGIQSKALSKRFPVSLGSNLDNLRSDWWIITIHANSDNPSCYILRLDEVRALAGQDKNGGQWWLDPKHYDRTVFRDAWHRLLPGAAKMPERNGIRHPKLGGKSAAVWAIAEDLNKRNGTVPSMADILVVVRKQGLNEGNARTEYSRWRNYHGHAPVGRKKKAETL